MKRYLFTIGLSILVPLFLVLGFGPLLAVDPTNPTLVDYVLLPLAYLWMVLSIIPSMIFSPFDKYLDPDILYIGLIAILQGGVIGMFVDLIRIKIIPNKAGTANPLHASRSEDC
jgi:hypothetical protein